MPKCKPCIIGSVYRTQLHKDAFIESFRDVLDLVSDEDKEIYILGDFNCDILTKTRSKVTKDLLSITSDVHLEQIIQEPTRITSTSESAIDLVFTSHTNRVIQKGVLHYGITDHSMPFIVRKAHILKCQAKDVWVRNYKNYDQDVFVILSVNAHGQ